MEGKATGTRDMMRVCLTAAATFLLIDLLLRPLPVSMRLRVILDLCAWPLALGLVTGVLVGSRWEHPWRAALLLATALVVAFIIPYTIDTIAAVNVSDESIVRMVRESERVRGYASRYATMAPRDIRASVVGGRILSFPLGAVFIGVSAVLGALVERRLSRGRRVPVAPPDAAGGASA